MAVLNPPQKNDAKYKERDSATYGRAQTMRRDIMPGF